MLLSKNIVYLQMHKAGSTHATNILQKYCGGHLGGRHSQLEDYDRLRPRLVVSSIRDPWDWYVSLWAFGCTGHGRLRDYVDRLPFSELKEARRHRDFATILRFPFRLLRGAPDWTALYADPGNEPNFRNWLKLLLGREGQHIGREGYASSPIKAVVGLMTYRFLALTTEYSAWMAKGRKCRTHGEVVAFAERHTITDRILRTEFLNDDLASLLNSVGVIVSEEEAAAWGKRNTSVRGRSSDYYDGETRELVAARDRFIVERFGYPHASP
jgi:hypothetical protein